MSGNIFVSKAKTLQMAVSAGGAAPSIRDNSKVNKSLVISSARWIPTDKHGELSSSVAESGTDQTINNGLTIHWTKIVRRKAT